MTAQDHPYVRVYSSIIDDPRFERVYPDDRALATWLRLLIEADAMYPAPAPLPRRAGALRLLVEVGIVELVGSDHYRIHGLVSERSGRYAGGRGRSRFPSDHQSESESISIPTRNGPYSDSEYQPEPSRVPRARPARAPAAPLRSAPLLSAPLHSSDVPADALDDYYRLTLRYPTGRTKEWLTELANEFGHPETGRALAGEWRASNDPKSILSRCEARLRSEAHHAERERAKPKPRLIVTPEEAVRLEEARLAIIADLTTVTEELP